MGDKRQREEVDVADPQDLPQDLPQDNKRPRTQAEDQTLVCEDCGEDFLFTIRQQMYLPEPPTRCVECEEALTRDVCFDWRRGLCRFGDNCKFRHIGDGNTVPMNTCFEWKNEGTCKYGDSCKFSHGNVNDDVKTPHDRQQSSPQEKQHLGICYSWIDGNCAKGSSCRFKHDDDGTTSFPEQRARSSKICYDFLDGICRRGNNCRFSHDGRSSGVCFEYLNGYCSRGVSCRFSHEMGGQGYVAGGYGAGYGTGGYSTGSYGGFAGYGGYGGGGGYGVPEWQRRGWRERPEAAPSGGRGVCFAWRDGMCRRGDQCRFRHDMGMEDGVVDHGAPRPPSHNVCFSFMENGHCSFGESCRFQHMR